MHSYLFLFLIVLTSCAGLAPEPRQNFTYIPPTMGPQLDPEGLRDFHLDRLR